MSLFGALEICEEILRSKKYATLHRPLVLRICEEEYKKYSNYRDRLKGAKNALHSIYGAYLTNNIFKKAEKLMEVIAEERGKISQSQERLLRLHASTKERMAEMITFYQFIFEVVGEAESIIDIGCGFNPFTIPYYPVPPPSKYYALDIDERMAELNNRYFRSLKIPELAGCIDITTTSPKAKADLAFLFKLLPLIDRQARGRSSKLLREIDAQHLIITYPTKSLTGKEKGMQAFYAAAFEEVIGGNLFITAKKQIGNELVYVVAKR